MIPDLVYEIMSLALSLVQSERNETPKDPVTVANILLQIIQAYSQQVGQIMDPSLIKVENPV